MHRERRRLARAVVLGDRCPSGEGKRNGAFIGAVVASSPSSFSSPSPSNPPSRYHILSSPIVSGAPVAEEHPERGPP